MKRNLRLLILMMLFSVSFAQAQKTDVWDFGGAELDVNLYNNMLTPAIINTNFYAFTTPALVGGASTSNVLTHGGVAGNTNAFDLTGGLTFRPNTNDRLYVNTPTTITRYGDNNLGVSGTTYISRIFCNGASSTSVRYFTMALNEDDEVTFVTRVDNAIANLNVVNTTTNTQTENIPIIMSTSAVTEAKFMANSAGSFRIFCAGSTSSSRPSYYRVFRKPASYSNVAGTVDETAASGIPAGYSVRFTYPNGKTKDALVTLGAYNISLPIGYTYKMSLVNANGYVIISGENMTVTTASTTQNISVLKVVSHAVSGNVTGLGTSLSSATLVYTSVPAQIYVPKPVITTATSTYAVDLEENINYTISATGVNDYEILANTINVSAATTSDIVFTAKPVYPVTITPNGLTTTQAASLSLTFTNVNEAGYVYTFAAGAPINLRTGTYSIAYNGLDNQQVELGLTSYLKVTGAATTKVLEFKPVSVWSFDDRTITTASTAYKGILFGGTANSFASRSAQADLTAKTGGTMQIPVKVGDKITVSHYFAANFSIDGGTAIVNTSGTTNTVENTEYVYPGTADGYVTITLLGTNLTSYFPEIKIGGKIPYTTPIAVGTDKPYKTINEALTAVGNMARLATERVVIMIDPADYQEMVHITLPNITLKNAAATPSIALTNQGVNIDANAVRITSYYGIGYNYFSMKNNQKWDADILRVNKDNGFQPYANVSGTTNNSYWNATLIVAANGIELENIIIENSFNQYISTKEADDVLVEVVGATKGARPTTAGSTAVQNRSFVERAAAIAIPNGIDKTVLNNCRVVGRQDSFFGGTGARVAIYKGVMMGAVDYMFGPMIATFYQTDLAMNVSDTAGDASYLTAPQQGSGRGYLFYECKVTSAIPGIETASVYRAKPGFFGRPWAATTSEVVMYNTTIETSDYPGNDGESLITPTAWNSSLSGTSAKMYEYGTIENSGINNQAARASWATTLTVPTLTDGTPITTLEFTKGSDGWDPFPALIALGTKNYQASSSVNVFANKNNVTVSNVKSNTKVLVYGLNGALVKSLDTDTDTNFDLKAGVWIVLVKSAEGQKAVKVMTY